MGSAERNLIEYELELFGGELDVVPESADAHRDLRYGPQQHQRLDLYLPKGRASRGVVVFAHGGGWCCGTRLGIPRFMVDLTEQGWAVASISYSLYTQARGSWPENLHDFKRATRWLRSQAETYSLNPDVVIAAGTSAGGHLAALAANTSGRSFEPPNLPAELAQQRGDYQGVVSLVGPVNLVRFYRSGASWSALAGAMVGCGTRCSDAQLIPASPLHQLHAGSPPHYMVYGVQDALITIGELWDYLHRWYQIFSGDARHRFWFQAPDHDHNIEAPQVNLPLLRQFLNNVANDSWTPPPVQSRCGFGDVPPTSYYAQATCWLKASNITTGYAGNPQAYAPHRGVDRAQMAAFLYRSAGSPPAPTRCGFGDVPPTSYYAQATCWLKASNITTGYAGNPQVYAPHRGVDRAQMAAFLYRLSLR